MFSIEHQFDQTVITLVDEGEPELHEDVIVRGHDDHVTLEQEDEHGAVLVVSLSMTQVRDLVAALNLPEGVYRRGGARD